MGIRIKAGRPGGARWKLAGIAAVAGLAGVAGLPVAHFVAAAGAALAIPLTRRWKLQTAIGLDLTPSMHWPVPVIAAKLANDQGPVLVSVEYRVEPENRAQFLRALSELEHERKRDGAYFWGLFEDVSDRGRFEETFLVESWLEHLHQHERVTMADQVLQDRIERLVTDTPRVRHLIAPHQEMASTKTA